MPATLPASRRVGRRAALRAGRALARAVRGAPFPCLPPTALEFVRALETLSISSARQKAPRIRPGIGIPFDFVSNLETASISISRREAFRLAARAYRRALGA